MAIQKLAKNVKSTEPWTFSSVLVFQKWERVETMFHRSVLLLWSVIAVSSGSDNKTDLADYTLVGDNITELNLSLNTEYTQAEEDLENDAPIDAGRRKGKFYLWKLIFLREIWETVNEMIFIFIFLNSFQAWHF